MKELWPEAIVMNKYGGSPFLAFTHSCCLSMDKAEEVLATWKDMYTVLSFIIKDEERSVVRYECFVDTIGYVRN